MDEDELTPECPSCGRPRSLSVSWARSTDGAFFLVERWGHRIPSCSFIEESFCEINVVGKRTRRAIRDGLLAGKVDILEMWDDA